MQTYKSLTSIDYIILGLLLGNPMTGYGIRKIFETTALGNYSSSPGTIYPAIKRLLKFGLIEPIQSGESTHKSVFEVNGDGKSAFIDWLQSPVSSVDIQKKMDELILKFTFMDGLVSKEIQIQFLENMIGELKIYIQQLNDFIQDPPKNLRVTAKLALEHGLLSYKSSLFWAKKSLKVIQTNT